MREENPCDICKYQDKCWEIGCPLKSRYNKVCECEQYECFLNHESMCAIGIYDNCGSRMTADGTVPEEE